MTAPHFSPADMPVRSDVPAARLQVSGLECRRGERTLIRGLSLTVHPGQIVWLRGANGQGKTTLLRTLAGLTAPEAGEIRWADGASTPPFLYLAHANALKDDLTATESLRFLLRLSASTAPPAALDQALDEALDCFGLASRRHAAVRTLSQGRRRRVALARLAVRPTADTWLLDEPFDALDVAGVDALNGLLAAHATLGGSVVLTSHVPLAIAAPVPFVVTLESVVAA